MPHVFARTQDGKTRVDLLHISPTDAAGLELRTLHWDDFGNGAATIQTLVGSTSAGTRINQVGWFGYDAVRKGNDLAVVVHEQSFDDVGARDSFWSRMIPIPRVMGYQGRESVLGNPVLPSLSAPFAAPSASHSQQLRLMVID